MEELTTKGFDATQYIVVQLGVEQYGIDIQYVDNIVRMQNITRVPKVAKYINGVINLRGEVIPVMSIRLKMGFEVDEFTKNTRIIILKLEQHGTIGIIVDEVKNVITLSDDDIDVNTSVGNDEKSQFITGVGKQESGLITLLNLQGVIIEKENADKA